MEHINWLNNLNFFGIKPGLGRITKLLKKFSNPHKNLKTIHIAGTNGKGSTAKIISTILKEHGFKVGLYTSPHLFKVNERFLINNKEISDSELNEYLKRIRKALNEIKATYFEITTCVAFLYFAENNVDFAVIECGMGGRLDATNVIYPEVAVITSIGFDHQKFLGNTLEKIAWEKANIIKRNCYAVIGEEKKEPLQVIMEKAKTVNAYYFIKKKDFQTIFKKNSQRFTYWDYLGKKQFKNLEFSLNGLFQGSNLACALKNIEILEEKRLLSINETALRNALKKVKNKGRYEKHYYKDKFIILDSAHNLQGFCSLKESLEKEGFLDFILLLGITNRDGDKDYLKMLKILEPLAKKIYLSEFPSPKKIVKIEDWKNALSRETHLTKNLTKKIKFFSNPLEAFFSSLQEKEEKILITGSIFFITHFLKILSSNS